MTVRYFAGTDDEGTPLGLFRILEDDDNQTLDMEYLNADGAWVNDPTVIDELREPGVSEVQASDVPDIADAITGGKGAEAVMKSASEDAAAEKEAGVPSRATSKQPPSEPPVPA